MPALEDNSNSSLTEHLLLAEDEKYSAAEQRTLLVSSAVAPERPDESSATRTRMVTNNGIGNGDGDRDELSNSHHSDPAGVQRRATMRLTQARTFWEEHCVYLPAMLGWFLFSALLSSYNKVRWRFFCQILFCCFTSFIVLTLNSDLVLPQKIHLFSTFLGNRIIIFPALCS